MIVIVVIVVIVVVDPRTQAFGQNQVNIRRDLADININIVWVLMGVELCLSWGCDNSSKITSRCPLNFSRTKKQRWVGYVLFKTYIQRNVLSTEPFLRVFC